jgi:predicted transcriptional regulator
MVFVDKFSMIVVESVMIAICDHNITLHHRIKLTQEKKEKKMKLSEYLEEYNLTPGKLAAKAGINPCSVYKVLEGNKDSRASILMKISLVTKKKVTMEEMVNMEKVKEKAIRRKKPLENSQSI